MPTTGTEVYTEYLTSTRKDGNVNRKFIQPKRIYRALGLGLLHPLLLKDVLFRKSLGKSVLDMDYLLTDVIQKSVPLNFTRLLEMQDVIPLNIIASGCKSEKSVVLSSREGNWNTMKELAECMHASMLLPGLAGPVMRISRGGNMIYEDLSEKKNSFPSSSSSSSMLFKNIDLSHQQVGDENIVGEPLVDALLYEPVPYRSAIASGSTHVLAIRSRPDGANVLEKPTLLERMMMKRYFQKKFNLPRMYNRVKTMLHKMIYSEDVIFLDEKNLERRNIDDVTKGEHIMCLALGFGSPEIKRLETGREAILDGVRRGFALTFNALVEDPSLKGKGDEISRKVFT